MVCLADVLAKARRLATQLEQVRQCHAIVVGGVRVFDPCGAKAEPGVHDIERGRLPLAERQFLQAQVLTRLLDAAVEQQELLACRFQRIPGLCHADPDLVLRLAQCGLRLLLLRARSTDLARAIPPGQEGVLQANAEGPIGVGQQRILAVQVVLAEQVHLRFQ